MDVIRTAAGIREACRGARRDARSIGFVPTMGALHDGHASLIRLARTERDVVVLSIFVNPKQFAPDEGLERYPRDEEGDLERAEALGVDLAFVPPVEEIYPPDVEVPEVDPGPVGHLLEGASRPGHFRGVLTVVRRLLDLVGGCAAYFGEKDAQQLFLVREMVRELDLLVDVVPSPTVRDPDGLAVSSRNADLSGEERDAAGCLFLALSEAAELARAGERDARVLVAVMAREIGATPLAKLDYVAVVDERTFEEIDRIRGPARALVAAWVGETRLIDNLRLPEPPR